MQATGEISWDECDIVRTSSNAEQIKNARNVEKYCYHDWS